MEFVSKTTGGKLRATPKLAAFVAREFAKGSTLPETIAKADSKTGEATIHLVSPLYWNLAADALGAFPAEVREDAKALRSAVRSARKAGERREIVARRAGISVARVREIEGKRPVYTGRGTRSHLAVAS